MIRATIASLLTTLGAPFTAQADECDAATSRVIAATGASFVRRSHVASVLRHPLVGEGLTVYGGPAGTSVSVSWASVYPPRAVFDLMAKAGAAVTGDPAWLLEPTMTKCHAKALKEITADEPDADSDGFRVGQAEMECAVFSHHGGGGTLTISKRRG